MSTAIFMGFPAYGHVLPALKTAVALKQCGYQVYFFCTEDYQKLIESKGLEFKPYETSDIFYKNSEWFKDTIDALYSFTHAILMTTKEIIKNHIHDVQLLKADIIIYDSFAIWGKWIAHNLGIPAIQSITNFALNTAVKNQYPRVFYQDYLHLTPDSPRADRDQRRLELYGIGLKRKYPQLFTCFEDLFLSDESINLVYTSRKFHNYSKFFGKNYYFVGPVLTQQEVICSESTLDCGKKTIVISFGTILHSKHELYKLFFSALGESEYEVILSVGKTCLNSLGPIPENFEVFHYFNQIELLKNANLLITHGGMNSTCEALYFGVPLIVIPQTSDQFLVSESVEKTGAGIRLSTAQLNESLIKQSVERIFTDARIKASACEIGNSFRNAGGLKRAVQIIQSQVEK